MNPFDDDFSQTVLFEADFSQANFHPPVTSADLTPDEGATPTPAPVVTADSADPQAITSSDIEVKPDEPVVNKQEFKVPPIPNIKNKVRHFTNISQLLNLLCHATFKFRNATLQF